VRHFRWSGEFRLVVGAEVARDPCTLQAAVLWMVPDRWFSESGFRINRLDHPCFEHVCHAVLVHLGLGVPMAQLAHLRGDAASASNVAALLAVHANWGTEPTLTSETAVHLGPPLDACFEAALRQLR
jgi:hypothetical protein